MAEWQVNTYEEMDHKEVLEYALRNCPALYEHYTFSHKREIYDRRECHHVIYFTRKIPIEDQIDQAGEYVDVPKKHRIIRMHSIKSSIPWENRNDESEACRRALEGIMAEAEEQALNGYEYSLENMLKSVI